MYDGNRPNSALQALFVVFLCTCRMLLQNSKCIISTGGVCPIEPNSGK